MDAKKFGAFLALCRREKGLTQGALAEKLHVTDKAVSRWERGVGFPDIATLEPLADALEISVLELMRSEKLETGPVPREEAAAVVLDTLDAAKAQRRQERRRALVLLGLVAAADLAILLMDTLEWQGGTILALGAGVAFPMFCLGASLSLAGVSLLRLLRGRPWRCTALIALGFVVPLLLFLGLFLLAGALGLGPVPN